VKINLKLLKGVLLRKKLCSKEDERKQFLKKISVGSKVYTYWDAFIAKNKLPPYDWIVKNIFIDGSIKDGIPNRHHQYDHIFAPCQVLEIFQFYSEEFIAHIVKTINKLGAHKIIEIGAGDGFLSHFLKRKGIDIIPTDDCSRPYIKYTEQVKKLNHKEALKKYKPDLVVINWEELDATYSIDALNYASVKYLLWIGEGHGGCTGSKDLWEYDSENTKNPYCLSRTDDWAFRLGIEKHTFVMIFHPKKSSPA
jgi:hypothetical protein